MVEEKTIFPQIEEILREAAVNWKKDVIEKYKHDEDYYKAFGNPFLTIYQILSIWARNNKEDFISLGKPIGGAGAGKNALSINISRELSKKIQNGTITNIELGQLSNLEFINGDIFVGPNISNPDDDITMRPANPDGGIGISLFRYKELI